MSAALSQTAAANQARRKRTEEKLGGVAYAIAQLQRRRLPVTYPAIAARAGVSRTFLYDNPAARDLVTAAITRAGSQRQHDTATRDAEAEASWQQRALNASRPSRPRTPRSAPSAPASANCSASSATSSTSATAMPPAGSAPRTPRSGSASATSPPDSAPWKNGCRPPAPTTASSTSASPTSKRRCWPRSREPDPGQPLPRRPPDMRGTTARPPGERLRGGGIRHARAAGLRAGCSVTA
jgi:Family of unknown function (DUF6262)